MALSIQDFWLIIWRVSGKLGRFITFSGPIGLRKWRCIFDSFQHFLYYTSRWNSIKIISIIESCMHLLNQRVFILNKIHASSITSKKQEDWKSKLNYILPSIIHIIHQNLLINYEEDDPFFPSSKWFLFDLFIFNFVAVKSTWWTIVVSPRIYRKRFHIFDK